MVFPRERC
nr:unnamed protein product [Callosobruchus chinensis]